MAESGMVYIAVGVSADRSHSIASVALRAAQVDGSRSHVTSRQGRKKSLAAFFSFLYASFQRMNRTSRARLRGIGEQSVVCSSEGIHTARGARGTDHALSSRAEALLPRATKDCPAALQDVHD